MGSPPGAVLVVVLALVAAGVVAGSGSARAETARVLAEQRVDVDTDGVIDTVRIEEPAAVLVLFGAKGAGQARKSAWKAFTTSGLAVVGGSLSAGSGERYGGKTVIVAVARFARAGVPGAAESEEAMVLSWQRGALVALWNGAVGWQGHDGDYRVDVSATPEGLIRYQSRPDIQRCDGKGAELFFERYDFRQQRFRSAFNPVDLPADARVLVADKRWTGPPVPGGDPSLSAASLPALSFRAQAASTQAGVENAGELAPPREIDDGDLATAWREELGGNGRGEFITFTSSLAAPPRVVAVRIVPGDAQSRDLFRRANRLRRAGLLVGDRAYWIDVPRDPASDGDVARPYFALLPEPVTAACATLIVESTYPGSAAPSAQSGDTVIAEAALLGDLDLAPGGAEATLAARVAAGGESGREAERILAGHGERAAAVLLAELEAGRGGAAERARLRALLARVVRRDATQTLRKGSERSEAPERRDGKPASRPARPSSPPLASLADDPGPAIAAQLVAGLTEGPLNADDLEVYRAALVALSVPALPLVIALLRDAEAPSIARQRAAGVLASLAAPEARDALIATAGDGDRPLRKAVIAALAARAPEEIAAILTAVREVARADAPLAEADLWGALVLLSRRGVPADLAAIIAAITERLPAASGYELCHRLYTAAAALGDASALDALASVLARLPETTPRQRGLADVLRRVVASAIAGNPDARGRALLADLIANRDPGVRQRATAAIGLRDDASDATDRAIIGALEHDRWPTVRRTAAAALGRRCRESGSSATALFQAVDHDDDVEVRRVALGSLVACRAPGIGERLLAVAQASKQPVKVRERAIALVAELAEPGASGQLAVLFGGLREQAWSSEEAVTLAASVAVAMGRLGGAGVLAPLLAAARDDSFPDIQAAAVAGLGEMCPREALPLFVELSRSSQVIVAIAARGARARCGGSGGGSDDDDP